LGTGASTGEGRSGTYLTSALLKVGLLYDRYTARKAEWLKYTARRGRLRRIKTLAANLASTLEELDILSRDDLAARFGQNKIEELLGSLIIINKKAKELEAEVQKDGRPRDLAEERWAVALQIFTRTPLVDVPASGGQALGRLKDGVVFTISYNASAFRTTGRFSRCSMFQSFPEPG
jgi:hypothetical protein